MALLLSKYYLHASYIIIDMLSLIQHIAQIMDAYLQLIACKCRQVRVACTIYRR